MQARCYCIRMSKRFKCDFYHFQRRSLSVCMCENIKELKLGTLDNNTEVLRLIKKYEKVPFQHKCLIESWIFPNWSDTGQFVYIHRNNNWGPLSINTNPHDKTALVMIGCVRLFKAFNIGNILSAVPLCKNRSKVETLIESFPWRIRLRRFWIQ